MGLIILLLLIAVPLIEIGLFIQVGGWVGGWSTVGLVILTAVVGLSLVRAQGMGVLKKIDEDARAGGFPVGTAFHGVALFIAGALLLTPGFLTDTVGFLLLIPQFRSFLSNSIQTGSHFRGHFKVHNIHEPHQRGQQSTTRPGMQTTSIIDEGIVIEGEFEEIEPENNHKPKDGS